LTVNTLTLWDSSAGPSQHEGLVYRWNGYSEKDSVHSLLRHVETHGERLRRKYLAWIHELGESRIDGKRLIDHLAFEDGLSYWWMTSLVEKSTWKSAAIIDAIRLLALEEIVVQQRPSKLRLVSANQCLHEVLTDLSQKLNLDYEWERLPNQTPRQLSLREVYHALPRPVQALISFVRHVRNCWPLRRAEKSGWFGGDQSVFFCSYFINIDPKAAEHAHFYSYFWGGMHGLLNRIGCQSNWLHVFLPSGTVPTPRAAMSWVQRFNQRRQEQGFHAFIDGYLSWRIVLRVLKRWFKLTLISYRLKEIKHAFRPPGSRVSLWPLLRGDWHSSMRGPVAISELLWIELFDKALQDVPHQKRGLYLCENQPWERALIHAWRKHGHDQLIAVVHSTVRFWHLSYFSDPRTLRSSDPRPMPQPDFTALNGKAAVDAYLNIDYPKGIVECEALRFIHANDSRIEHTAKKADGEEVKVLILGDYTSSCTTRMLKLLEAAVPQISDRFTYTVKPHPSTPVVAADYPSLNLRIVEGPLNSILRDFDISFSSNRTSAGLDAYLIGMLVVVMLDETELNFSPLRGRSDVSFVSTPEELAAALQTASQGAAANPDGNDFFFLDPELPRWKRLLTPAAG
jgi:surface carbohydrate biosynthesis protein (TIGR04326 family)